MKRSENGMVIPFEKFTWDNFKSKLVIKLPPKVIENPLLLYIEFGENSEHLCFGEEKAVRQIAEKYNLIPKHKSLLLMLSEELPLGSLLMDSYDFVANNLQSVINIFRSMLHSIDSGNSEKGRWFYLSRSGGKFRHFCALPNRSATHFICSPTVFFIIVSQNSGKIRTSAVESHAKMACKIQIMMYNINNCYTS